MICVYDFSCSVGEFLSVLVDSSEAARILCIYSVVSTFL